jgi:TfoX/Sxy family transcriptional regulator of competence genes
MKPARGRSTGWKKATEEMVALFDSVVPAHPAVARRKMFGYPAGFANGHLFMGLFEDRLFLRLGEPERETFLGTFAATLFEPMPGRAMRDYVIAPRQVLEKPDVLRRWCGRALDHALSLPAKTTKAKPASRKPAKSAVAARRGARPRKRR